MTQIIELEQHELEAITMLSNVPCPMTRLCKICPLYVTVDGDEEVCLKITATKVLNKHNFTMLNKEGEK